MRWLIVRQGNFLQYWRRTMLSDSSRSKSTLRKIRLWAAFKVWQNHPNRIQCCILCCNFPSRTDLYNMRPTAHLLVLQGLSGAVLFNSKAILSFGPTCCNDWFNARTISLYFSRLFWRSGTHIMRSWFQEGLNSIVLCLLSSEFWRYQLGFCLLFLAISWLKRLCRENME